VGLGIAAPALGGLRALRPLMLGRATERRVSGSVLGQLAPGDIDLSLATGTIDLEDVRFGAPSRRSGPGASPNRGEALERDHGLSGAHVPNNPEIRSKEPFEMNLEPNPIVDVESEQNCSDPLRARETLAGSLTRMLAAVAVGAVLACDSGPPEEQLAEARYELEQVRSEVKALETQVGDKKEAVRDAESQLARARAELDRAQSELAAARRKIQMEATDVALFRAVQTALLEADSLEAVAVRAEVASGVVTLHGQVNDTAQATAAMEIAQSVAGVDRVVNEIRVRGDSAGGS
jgi:hypothetical protein